MHAAVALVAQQPCSVDDRQEQVTPTNLQAKRQEAPFLFGYEEKVPGQWAGINLLRDVSRNSPPLKFPKPEIKDTTLERGKKRSFV